MKLADEPLAPKKKAKSKVKLAAKAKKAKKRGAIGTATLMTRAYWGSLFDPAYSPFPKKKKSNIHGVYDDVVLCNGPQGDTSTNCVDQNGFRRGLKYER